MLWLSAAALLAWGWAMGTPGPSWGFAERVAGFAGGLARRLAARAGRKSLDIGELLAEVAGRLRSGVSPAEAWGRAAERLGLPQGIGGDGVPALVGRLPPSPAASGTRAACSLAAELGAPAADILDECLVAVTQAEAEESARAVAIAGPAASARLLAALPAVGVLLSMALGADPLDSALGGGLGSLAVLAGVVAYAAGIAWTRRLVAEARTGGEPAEAKERGGRKTNREGESGSGAGGSGSEREKRRRWPGSRSVQRPVPVDAALLLHLLRAALLSGVSVPRALEAVGESAGMPALSRTSRLLLLGADWEEAWDGVTGAAEVAGRALEPAWCDGADPIPLLERAASAWYVRRDRRLREQAAKLGVRLVLPLGVCFLPAFMLVSVAPVLLATGGGLFPA